MKAIKSLFSLAQKHAPLLAGLLLIAPLFFFQAFRSPFPLGYAGMFTQMAEQIAAENFFLPLEIPHYGPGGIPFVYPPLAMYVFAFALKLGISAWAYLRLAPALFTLLALVPFYFLFLELTRNKTGAQAALLLVATAPAIYYTHIWSAGVVRGLALALCFAGLLFYLRTLREFSWRDFFLSGLFLGLLLTTHLLYVAFAALIGIAFLLSERKLRGVWLSFGIFLLALLVASPWLGLVLSRHGPESLLAAASSHRNTDFFSLLIQDSGTALAFLLENLLTGIGSLGLALLALPGLVLLLLKRKFHLPLLFLLTLVMGEASIFLPISAALIAGNLIAQLLEWAAPRTKLAQIGLSILLAAEVLFSAAGGVLQIVNYEPEIDVYSLKMSEFVRENTAPEQTYLYIGKINEAEWFPYLLNRTPVFALWGSEWRGIYAEQLQILTDLRTCQDEKDWVCMQTLLDQNKADPQLLIGPNRRWLELQIKETRAWELVYSDERYLVWEKKK